ncbi:MAG: type I secretion system permease/ATPase [Caulobacterales bacterium]
MREAATLVGGHLRFALLFSALVNVAYLAPTIYMLQVYDRVLPSSSKASLALLTVALALTLLTLTTLDRVRSRILLSASVKLDQAFAARLVRRVLSASDPGGQPRLNQLIRDFDTIRLGVTGPAAIAVFDAPWIPIYVLVCFIVHPLIGWLTLAGAAVLVLLAVLNEQVTRDLSKRASEASAAGFGAQDSAAAAADVVRSLGMTEAFVRQFEDARAKANQPQLRASRATGRISGLTRFIRLFLQSVALGAGAWLAINKQISAGAVFASSMLAARALAPIDQIVVQWRAISAALTAYVSLRERLRDEDTTTPTALPRPAARLTLDRASVLAPSRDRVLLNNVSLEAEGGQVIGVIGASGAGKTTLLQLIANARGADQGEARLDGARYSDWEPQRLGRLIGYIPQDCALFPGSIKDNISRFDRWADVPEADVDAGAVAAAKAAGVHDLILSLPKGYDTPLGLRGRGLSAGQQQRIALARALYGEPLLYVFDEPNSNADGEAEMALQQVMARLRGAGAIVVVAAQRLSLIGGADRILVMSGGRVERQGPREEVLASLRTTVEPLRRPTVAGRTP